MFLAARGRTASSEHCEWESTDAGHRGGPARSSGEGPVMGSERRGRAVHGRVEVNPSGEEPTDRPRQKNAGLWEPYDGRLSRTVLREREGEVPSRHSPAPRMQRIMPGQHTRPYFRAPTGGRGSNHRLTARPHRRRPCCVKQGTPIRAKADSAHTEGPAGSTTSGWCTRSAGPTRECLLHRVSQPVISSHTSSGSSSWVRAPAHSQRNRVRVRWIDRRRT